MQAHYHAWSLVSASRQPSCRGSSGYQYQGIIEHLNGLCLASRHPHSFPYGYHGIFPGFSPSHGNPIVIMWETMIIYEYLFPWDVPMGVAKDFEITTGIFVCVYYTENRRF